MGVVTGSIATANTKDAAGLDRNRFLYDDQRSSCRSSAEPKNHFTQLNWNVRMNILPAFELKALSECKGGRLVRPLSHFGKEKFALVADLENNDRRALIMLQEDGPVFVIVEQPDQHHVLEYSGDLILELDQGGPFSSGFGGMYGQVGCMVHDGTRSLLNVRPGDIRWGPDIVQFNCQTFMLEYATNQSHSIAVFGKWKMYIGEMDGFREKWVRVADFEWSPPREPST